MLAIGAQRNVRWHLGHVTSVDMWTTLLVLTMHGSQFLHNTTRVSPERLRENGRDDRAADADG